MSPLGIYTTDNFEKKMVPAHKFRCKDEMKYYLDIKKITLMCHTSRETTWGQIFYKIKRRNNEWDTIF
jgi:hypothetical protein